MNLNSDIQDSLLLLVFIHCKKTKYENSDASKIAAAIEKIYTGSALNISSEYLQTVTVTPEYRLSEEF